MSELIRFRVARSPQKFVPCDSADFIPLYIKDTRGDVSITNHIIRTDSSAGMFFNYLLSRAEEAADAANDYVDDYTFVKDKTRLSSSIGTIDEWLSCKENRPSPAELLKQLDNSPKALVKSPEWRLDRKNVADSLVASLIANVNASVRVFLHRLLVVFGLVELMAIEPTRLKTPDDIYWALRWRTVVLDPLITNYLRSRRSILARNPGRADMYVVRDEWIKYEAGEIAHIENVLPGELKERELINLTESEQTITNEEDTVKINERDNQTTDRFDLHDESSTDTNLAVHIDGKVDTSGQYGPTKVDTHIGGDFSFSKADSSQHATNLATESVARAVTRVEERIRQIRITRTLNRITETNKHSLTNADKIKPIVGIYRWVNKVQRIQIFRFPNRFLLEFQIPEPSAWWRWLKKQGQNKGLLTEEPIPLTVNGNPQSSLNPLLKSSDITPNNYLELGSRYATLGLKPPPINQVVAVAMKRNSPDEPYKDNDPSKTGKDLQIVKFDTETTMTVPTGCRAVTWTAYIHSRLMLPILDPTVGSESIDISVGAGDGKTAIDSPSIDSQLSGNVGDISEGAIPVALKATAAAGFAIVINVTCQPTEQAINQWRIDCYDLISQNYHTLKREHDAEISASSIRQGVEIAGSSSERNKEIIRDELKKLVIEMLTGSQFKGRPAMRLDPNTNEPALPPSVELNLSSGVSSEIQFLEQAFEWENLTYICYPYYWAADTRWPDLADTNSNESDFARFLRAGSARVVVPARPGFEDQVNLYTDIGVLWGGGPIPSPMDSDYLSIAAEIRAQQKAPRDGDHGESWEVRLPTTLVWLENSAGLPEKPVGQRELDAPPGNNL